MKRKKREGGRGEAEMGRVERERRKRRERHNWLVSLSRFLRTVYHRTWMAIR